ncbi:mechanosensitive ion channel family protein [Candidatus Fokinia crypta]|uniref:Small/low conductance mechanosensitive channel n=1 Tax=Candidatus Fokinia crypta TaxID=1920990 RepID=A0ABZ0UQG5_9RICK|nr:mechanosensitive ion channel domain-containing protein [Candidatus Fokinia cryptica]WPX97802.1 Small/low conductance mechanosensitive channel [Candidatus Fokinia cryptica]
MFDIFSFLYTSILEEYRTVIANSVRIAITISWAAIILYVLSLIRRILVLYKNKRSSSSSNYWYRIALSGYTPIRLLIMVVSIRKVATMLIPKPEFMNKTVNIACILLAVNFIIRAIKITEKFIIHHTPTFLSNSDIVLDKPTVDVASKFISAIIVLFGAFGILKIFGLSIEGLMAFSGISGLLIAVASRDWLSGVVGTLSIYADQQFKIGHKIKLLDNRLLQPEGVVERINWRFTHLRGMDNKSICIPNLLFISTPVENASKITKVHVAFNIYISTTSMNTVSEFYEKFTMELTETIGIIPEEQLPISILEATSKRTLFRCNTFFERQDINTADQIKLRITEVINKICNNLNVEYEINFL